MKPVKRWKAEVETLGHPTSVLADGWVVKLCSVLANVVTAREADGVLTNCGRRMQNPSAGM